MERSSRVLLHTTSPGTRGRAGLWLRTHSLDQFGTLSSFLRRQWHAGLR
ncbi:hypothetical protein [Streptomyces canus]